MPTIAITGASGFIGSALARCFESSGWSVIRLARDAGQSIDPMLRPFNLCDTERPVALHDVDVLIHAAYVKHATAGDSNNANRDGTLRLFREARRHKVTRIVFISSFSAHSGARSSYGRHKLEIESWLNPENDVIIRPGLVIGNGGLFSALRREVQRYGVVPLIDGGAQPLQTVYIDDLVSAIKAAVEKPIHGPLNVAESSPTSYRQFFKMLACHVQKKVVMVPVNSSLVLMVLNASSAVGIRLPISTDNVLGARDLIARDTRAAQAALGINFRSAMQSLRSLSV